MDRNRAMAWNVMKHGVLLILCALLVGITQAQETFPPAPIEHDEGGPAVVEGTLSYSNAAFFLRGVSQPLVILEDQAGFVDRNRYFIISPQSQTLGQFTSDFNQSPVSYRLSLPIEPQGSYRDVDQDGERDQGVQIFAVAYWSNTFGGPFLEERDLYGGGWSLSYASTRASEEVQAEGEIIGGQYLVYASDDSQGFPSDFGADDRLFTEDDPIVLLPQGYTVVNLDTTPFTFHRERRVTLDLYEPDIAALADFSAMDYDEAFAALVEKMRREYAFTEYKGIDWDVLLADFLPRFEAAQANSDDMAFRRIFREFVLSINDGHMNAPFVEDDFIRNVGFGIGIAVQELSDGRVVVSYVAAGSPAAEIGIRQRAEIIAIDGTPISEVIVSAEAYDGPYSTDHARRLDQLRYVGRFDGPQPVRITFRNPGNSAVQSIAITPVMEYESFLYAYSPSTLNGYELPVEYTVLGNGYGLVNIYSLSENRQLTIQLWERMIQAMNELEVPGLIIDMRYNNGGFSFLTTQMAAYFFDDPLITSRRSAYDARTDTFISDPRGDSRFYLPDETLRYRGPVVVLVGPNCLSACEFFSYSMTLQDRAVTIGHAPTGGLGGGITSGSQVQMPEGIFFQFPSSRPLDLEGNIIIEGTGVIPDILVPFDEDAVFGGRDALLVAAVEYLEGLSSED